MFNFSDSLENLLGPLIAKVRLYCLEQDPHPDPTKFFALYTYESPRQRQKITLVEKLGEQIAQEHIPELRAEGPYPSGALLINTKTNAVNYYPHYLDALLSIWDNTDFSDYYVKTY